jgi:hypothetical protein
MSTTQSGRSMMASPRSGTGRRRGGFQEQEEQMLFRLEVHNRINMHTVYRMTSYRIQHSLVPMTVYGHKKNRIISISIV